MNLSKSLYTRGLQCPKSLWLKKHQRDVLTPPDTSAEAIFRTGDAVGALACTLFPNSKGIPFDRTIFKENSPQRIKTNHKPDIKMSKSSI